MVTEYFLEVLRSNKLEQFEFKLEKNIEIEKHAGKCKKNSNFEEVVHDFGRSDDDMI